MSISEEINSIINDRELSLEEKRDKLSKLVTPQELKVLLPMPVEVIKLKEPISPKAGKAERRVLNLSVVTPIFESILKGGHVECRDLTKYYRERCTYVENGVRYLTPFDAIRFYVGRGQRAKWATVEVKDIVYDDGLIYFYMGNVIEKYNASI